MDWKSFIAGMIVLIVLVYVGSFIYTALSSFGTCPNCTCKGCLERRSE